MKLYNNGLVYVFEKVKESNYYKIHKYIVANNKPILFIMKRSHKMIVGSLSKDHC